MKKMSNMRKNTKGLVKEISGMGSCKMASKGLQI
jgi:hypothetical protein